MVLVHFDEFYKRNAAQVFYCALINLSSCLLIQVFVSYKQMPSLIQTKLFQYPQFLHIAFNLQQNSNPDHNKEINQLLQRIQLDQDLHHSSCEVCLLKLSKNSTAREIRTLMKHLFENPSHGLMQYRAKRVEKHKKVQKKLKVNLKKSNSYPRERP